MAASSSLPTAAVLVLAVLHNFPWATPPLEDWELVQEIADKAAMPEAFAFAVLAVVAARSVVAPRGRQFRTALLAVGAAILGGWVVRAVAFRAEMASGTESALAGTAVMVATFAMLGYALLLGLPRLMAVDRVCAHARAATVLALWGTAACAVGAVIFGVVWVYVLDGMGYGEQGPGGSVCYDGTWFALGAGAAAYAALRCMGPRETKGS